MRGALWRVSTEQMRLATDDESKGVELVNQFLDSLRMDFQRNRGPKKFLDVMREGNPSFDEPAVPDDSDDDEATRTPGTHRSRLERAEAVEVDDETPNFTLARFGGELVRLVLVRAARCKICRKHHINMSATETDRHGEEQQARQQSR